MRRVFLLVLATLICLLSVNTALAQSEEEQLESALKSGEIIRLHVIAAGDDAENQRIKLCVRDKVLAAFQDSLSDKTCLEDMMDYLTDNLWALEEAAKKAAKEEGFTGPVSAQIGVFAFPDRWYGKVFVPAGEYKALRIVLGGGDGKNWWCVLFPSLCLSLSSSDLPPSEQTAVQIVDQTDTPVAFSWRVSNIFSVWALYAPV